MSFICYCIHPLEADHLVKNDLPLSLYDNDTLCLACIMAVLLRLLSINLWILKCLYGYFQFILIL